MGWGLLCLLVGVGGGAPTFASDLKSIEYAACALLSCHRTTAVCACVRACVCVWGGGGRLKGRSCGRTKWKPSKRLRSRRARCVRLAPAFPLSAPAPWSTAGRCVCVRVLPRSLYPPGLYPLRWVFACACWSFRHPPLCLETVLAALGRRERVARAACHASRAGMRWRAVRCLAVCDGCSGVACLPCVWW